MGMSQLCARQVSGSREGGQRGGRGVRRFRAGDKSVAESQAENPGSFCTKSLVNTLFQQRDLLK